MKLPADWKNLDSYEIVERLKSEPNVSADVLLALAASDNREVRRAVAWHDNTPDSALEALAGDNYSGVREAIEDRTLPREWRFLGWQQRIAALQSSEIAPDAIEALASSKDWSLRQAVALSPSTPESVLARLKEDEVDEVKFAATSERRLPIDWRFLDSWKKAERLRGETVDIEILEILASHPDSVVRSAVALNEETPERLLDILIEDDDRNVQSAIRERDLPDDWRHLDICEKVERLKRGSIEPTVLVILAQSGDWDVRKAAKKALKKRLPADWKKLDSSEIVGRLKLSTNFSDDVLIGLAVSDDSEVKRAIAHHQNTPDLVLELLTNDDDSDVQSAVRERDLPDDWKHLDEYERIKRLEGETVDIKILEILVGSPDSVVRRAIALNKETPDRLLDILIKDYDPDVRSAVRNRDLPDDWKHLDEYEKVNRLRSETVDIGILEILSGSPYSSVRCAVALNKGTPDRLLDILFKDDDSAVQSAVRERDLPDDWKHLNEYEKVNRLRGETVDIGILEILASHPNTDVRRAVALNKATPDRLLDTFIEDDDPGVQSAVRERDLPDNWKHLCLGDICRRLEKRGIEPTVLVILAQSGDWAIRKAVAQSPETPDEILVQLSEDYFSDVEAAAKKALKKRQGDSSEDDNSSTTQRIYIKTEPGGRIAFCELDSDLTQQLQESIANQELDADLEEMLTNYSGSMAEYEGVVNSGDEGDFGNEGTIVFSEYQPRLGPQLKDDGETVADGVYAVLMRLSKCSIEFEFTADGGFDEDEFEEISVPVRLPEEIVHGLYGHPDFNIIVGFRFRGEPVEDYDGEVEDRGYDNQFTFFAVKDGETTVLYSNYNGEEEWCDEDQAKAVLSSFL